MNDWRLRLAGARRAGLLIAISSVGSAGFVVALALLFASTSTMLAPRPASAHDPFQITADGRLRGPQLDVRIVMLDDTAAKLCLAPDGGRAKIDALNFERLRPRFEACALTLFRISSGADTLRPSRVKAVLSVENDVELNLTYPRPTASPLLFDAVCLRRFSDSTYGAELTVTSESVFLGQALLRADAPTLRIASLPDAAAGSGGGGTPPVASTPTFGQFLRLGIEHILTGFDHLLFLAGLLVACRRFRSVLTIVTCFTVAHSVTLALAALDVVALSGRIVEPAIAATIVFVGIENLLRGDEPKGRWALTFAFGLFHGFGFASTLKQIGLGANGAPLVLPLFSFNLGVELGQAAVAAVALPVLSMLRRLPLFAAYGGKAISIVVAGFGLYWLLARTVF